jgi:hypothetical protein
VQHILWPALVGISSPYNPTKLHRSPASTAAVNLQNELPNLVSREASSKDHASFEDEIGIPVSEVRVSDRIAEVQNHPLTVRKIGSEVQLLASTRTHVHSTPPPAVRPVLRSASRICVMLTHVL